MLRENPYVRFSGRRLTLNDYLAIDRTVLSNERTVLAFGRTSLAMLAIGGTLLKFFDSWWMRAIGVVFLIAAGLLMLDGWRRYRRVQKALADAFAQSPSTPDDTTDQPSTES